MAFDRDYDFVVVGSGAGSMCAGLVMRQAGLSVLVVEKEAFVGGTTAKSGGVMWIPNNRFMRRDGIADSAEQAATYLEGTSGGRDDTPGSTPERRRTYVEQAPRMVDFLVDRGIKLDRVRYWPDYYDELPGGVEQGRTVVAAPFDLKQLGPWHDKVRPGFLSMPATLDEAMQLPFFKKSWRIKRLMVRVGLRVIAAKLTGKRYVAAGAALQGRMLQAALREGVEFLTEAPVSELVVEDGRVTGILAQHEGKPVRIGARRGVLVNAGGFARNQAMRDQYQPGTRAEWSNAADGDTGEMIREMERLGAAIGQMEEMVGYQSTIPPGAETGYIKPPAQSLTAKPHAILVDQSGVRYQNEGGSYMAFCKAMLQRNKTVPAVPSWAIFDARFIADYMLAGTMPGANKPAAWTEQGYLRQAGSIEELAAKLDIDPAMLRSTVDRFNGFVDQGRDEDFHRGERAYDRWLGDPFRPQAPSLGRIDQGPFYAVPVVPGDVGTYGGVVTDARARVLRADGSAIPGLYATGVSTASVMGRAYPGAGSSIGPSMTWGYVAARDAAHLDNQHD
jgi:3-oxosteroid 1-dehydrogenase